MPIIPVNLNNKSNPARFKQGGAAQLINCYVEEIGKEGKVPWAIYASDGLQGFALLQNVNGGCRAAINVDGVLYVVAGTALYKVTLNGEQKLIGSMNISTTAPVFMERNRRAVPDIAIVCDGLMYYCRGDVLAQVVDSDLLAPITLAFSDGYFGITTAQNKWQIGAIDDASAWDGLDFATADADPDSLVRIAALQGQFMLFGTKSLEPWSDVGSPDFAYQRGSPLEVGLWAANSVATIEQTLAWIAQDRTVRMLGQGYGADRVSTPSVERDIQAVADPSTISATSWVGGGHTFYKITCPQWTWVYDTVTQLWHQRRSYGRKNWRVSFVVELGEKLIAGDADSGALFEMSPAFFDEAGAPLISTVVLPPVHGYPYSLTHNALYIDVERNVGTGQGDPPDVDPSLMVDWSDDDGETFKTQRVVSLGKQGQMLKRIPPLTRLGQAKANGRVYRFSWSAKVARALYQCSLDVEKDAA